MRLLVGGGLMLFFVGILGAGAHGAPFFEFAPDYFASYGLNVASSEDLVEIFIPQNDFLGGVDLWFDNAGEAGGVVTIELRDDQGNLLLTKGVTVPLIDPIAGGQRFHLDFPQMAVGAVKKYFLKIASSLPELQIYYSDRIRFLQHNAPYLSEYLNGAAKVGSEEKEFSFKFALYEGAENAPPVISNLDFSSLAGGKMRLDFNANEAVDQTVFWGIPGQGYGQNIPFSGQYQFCGAGLVFCSSTLQGISGQTYNYQLTVKDIWGNERNLTGIFTIPANSTFAITPVSSFSSFPSPSPAPRSSEEADREPPIISNLRLTEVTGRSVEIAWQTSEAADSSLLVSFTTELLTVAAANDTTLELEHVLKSGNILSPATPYLAVVTSRDASNNTASASLSFKTLPASTILPTPALSVSASPAGWPFGIPLTLGGTPDAWNGGGLHIVPISDDRGAVVISWTPLEEGRQVEGYRIDIFNDQHELARSLTISVETREVKITGLPDGEYVAIVYANENGVMRKVAKPTAFVIGQRALSDKLFALWPFLTAPLIILLLLVLKFLRKKIPVPFRLSRNGKL